MSRRRGATITVRTDTDGGVEPNRYIPQITAEIRVFAPPHTSRMKIKQALDLAVEEALERLAEEWPQ